MLTSVASSMWDDMLDPLKVTFDGDNRLIYINPQYSSISIKVDVYSAMKRWLQRRQNTQYYPPLRTIGGDQVGTSGQYAGDIYFLFNNWLMIIDHQVSVSGILYTDNYTTPYLITSGGGVIASVSNLAYSYNTVGATVPTASQIATQVWTTPSSGLTDVTTIGGQITTTKTNVDTIKVTTNNILAVSV
jgi:hypothetical protein